MHPNPAPQSRRAERGVTLTSYALVLALFVAGLAGIVKSVSDGSGELLIETGNDIGSARDNQIFYETTVLESAPSWVVSTTEAPTTTTTTEPTTTTTTEPPPPTPPTPTITSGNGSYEGPMPNGADMTQNGPYDSDDTVFLLSEGTHTLTSDLTVGGTTIPAGTVVCSYYLHYSPASSSAGTSVTFDFGAPVLGAATSDRDLDDTDVFGADDVDYRGGRSMEDGDGFSISGTTVSAAPWAVGANQDDARIFVAC